jgi:mannosyltransferase OCH1-like enzyme
MSIPKTFMQISRNKPEKYVIDKILSKCNGWNYINFNDSDEAIHFLRENYIEEFKDIVEKFNSIPKGAHKADLFRYYYLYLNGGVYMDFDAMIEMDIEDILKDYSFVSVTSYHENAIFNGFIASTPKNDIIYKALQNAYNIDIQLLADNFFLFCGNLYEIIKENNPNDGSVKLFNERFYNEDCSETYDDNNQTILFHYWRHKVIPN